MKKKLTIITLAALLALSVTVQAKVVAKETVNGYTISVHQNGTRTTVKWNGKTIHTYKFKGKVKMVSEKKLTYKALMHRKGKVLYIERLYGTILNKKLDGKTTADEYICYSRLKGKAKPGDEIITYCVYNPLNNWIDDISERYDIIL